MTAKEFQPIENMPEPGMSDAYPVDGDALSVTMPDGASAHDSGAVLRAEDTAHGNGFGEDNPVTAGHGSEADTPGAPDSSNHGGDANGPPQDGEGAAEDDDDDEVAHASPEEIKDTFAAAAAWLDTNGSFVVDQSDHVFGMQEGLPICHDGPYMEFVASGDAIRSVAPTAAAKFGIHTALDLTYRPEYFSYRADGLHVYVGSELQVRVPQPEDSPVDFRELFLIDTREAPEARPAWEASWEQHLRPIPTEVEADTPSIPDAFFADMQRVEAEAETGVNKASRAECRALREIAEKLDLIRQHMGQPEL